MKLLIEHSWDFDIDFKSINKMYHSMVYMALKVGDLQTKEFVKTNYAFKPPVFKTLNKGKTYILEFTSNDSNILELIKAINFKGCTIISIREDENMLQSKFLRVSNYHSLLNHSICENWLIDNLGKKSIQYRKQHSLKLLKELIEVQAITIHNRNSELPIECNSKLANGFEYQSFIKNIKIVGEVCLHIKNSYVATYDLIIEIDSNRNNNRLVNSILQTGIGCKNGYGLGFVESVNVEVF